MYMHRGSNGLLEELGKVYVYLQQGPLQLEPSECNLLGKEPFGRFGTSVAPLGDLDQDGFNGNLFSTELLTLKSLSFDRTNLKENIIKNRDYKQINLVLYVNYLFTYI